MGWLVIGGWLCCLSVGCRIWKLLCRFVCVGMSMLVMFGRNLC